MKKSSMIYNSRRTLLRSSYTEKQGGARGLRTGKEKYTQDSGEEI